MVRIMQAIRGVIIYYGGRLDPQTWIALARWPVGIVSESHQYWVLNVVPGKSTENNQKEAA